MQEKLKNKHLIVFLDYDGTLAPIAGRPDRARILPRAKSLLKVLSKIRDCRLAVISGRSLKDIKQMVGVPGIIYAGNHGLEAIGPGIRFSRKVSPQFKKNVRQLKYELTRQLAAVKGAFVEDKGLSLSLHYRLVRRGDIALLKRIFFGLTRGLLARRIIKVRPGKKVYEALPWLNWHKGKIVRWLLNQQRYLWRGKPIVPIYLGDDRTDEDAFKALGNSGVSVFVGRPGKSLACYYLKNTREVEKFLGQLLKIK